MDIRGQSITQSGKTVAGVSLQNINLNGANNDLIYDSLPGVTENINVIASTTAKQGQVSIPGVALWSFTNVPFSRFGEGSFDKGIRIVIPTEVALPFGTTTRFEVDVRPIQRDGGQARTGSSCKYRCTSAASPLADS